MKRKLSLLMVLMMVLSLVPAMPSFAVGGDIVVARVANDLVVGGATGGSFATDPAPGKSTWLGNNTGTYAMFDVNKAPALTFDNSETVKGSNNRPITSRTVFNITIQDPDIATFLEGAYGDERTKPSTGTVNGLMNSKAELAAINANGIADFHGDTVGVHVRRINPWTLEVVVDPNLVESQVNSSGLLIQTFTIPMFIRSNGKGEVKVGFDHMLSGFRDYTRKLTIANIYSTSTIAVVDKVANIARNNLVVEDSSARGRIKLIESTPNAWRALAAEARRDGSKVDIIKIRLDDADYSFADRGFGGFMRTNPLPKDGATYYEVEGYVRLGEVILGTTTYSVSQNASGNITYVGTSAVVGDSVVVNGVTYKVVGHTLVNGSTSSQVVWKDNPIYGREVTTTGAVYLDKTDDNRTVIVDLAKIAAFSEYIAGSRNEITLDLPILVKRGTPKESDVTVTLTGEVTPTSLVIAKYTDYTVKFTAEKVLDVVAGQDVQNKYMAKVFIEEMVPGSLLDGRVMSVRLTGTEKKDEKDVMKDHVAAYQYDGLVKLNKIKGTGDVNIVLGDLQGDGKEIKKGVGKSATVNLDMAGIDIFDLEINRGSNLPDYWKDKTQGDKLTNTAAKWELTFPVVVDTAYKGDLFLTFDGAGVSNQSVKIATVKAPITYEIEKADGGKLADLLIGKQHQDAPDVTITETEAGALQVVDIIRGYTNKYGFMGTGSRASDVLTWNGAIVNGKFSVKAGDADLEKNYGEANKGRRFHLRRKSTKATTFKAENVKVTLDRSVPYGPYKIDIDAGNVEDRHGSGTKHVSRRHAEPAWLSDVFATEDYFNVVTPYPEDVNVKTVFTIGEKKYVQTIAGIDREIEMDVEAQISNDRTMLPMRYVADAIGARVNYDKDSRVATFTKDNIVVSINIDSDTLYSNGSPVKLNAKPMNVNGRILLPLTNISQAFGLTNGNTEDGVNNDIEWDAAAKTVTLFGMKK